MNDTIPYIPIEIFVGFIFLAIPSHYLLVTRMVCKQWYIIIKSKIKIDSNLVKKLFSDMISKGNLNDLQKLIGCGFDFPVDDLSHLCNVAAKNGKQDILLWLKNNGHPIFADNLTKGAAIGGRLEILKWAVNEGHRLNPWLALHATLGGNLDVLKWYLIEKQGIANLPLVLHEAAFRGHLHILKWFIEEQKVHPFESTCSAAAMGGHFEILKWLRQISCPWNGNTCALAIKNNHLEIFEWAIENGCPWKIFLITNEYFRDPDYLLKWDTANYYGSPSDCDELIYSPSECAAQLGYLDILIKMKEKGYPLDHKIPIGAAKGNHLHILKWAFENGSNFGKGICSRVCKHAAKNGNLEILEWVKQQRDWTPDTFKKIFLSVCRKAASGGQLHVLKWARENNLPWDERTCLRAAYRGHLNILIWARQNGCPMTFRICRWAFNGRKLEVLKWTKENSLYDYDYSVVEHMIDKGQLHIIKWMIENDFEWNKKLTDHAKKQKQNHIIKWIEAHGF